MNTRLRQLVRKDLKEIINDCVDYHLPVIKGNTDLQKDLGFDSLDVVELIIDVEAKYNIHISDDKAEKVKTFNDAFNLLCDLVSETNF